MSDSLKFLNRATLFMVIDNVSKILEPILKLSCAKYFMGGAWGSFVFFESLVLIMLRFSLLGLDKGIIWFQGQCERDEDFFEVFSRAMLFAGLLGLGFALIGYWVPDHYFSFSSNTSFSLSSFERFCFFATIPFHAMTLICIQTLIAKRILSVGILIRNVIHPMIIYGTPLVMIFLFPLGAKLALCYLLAILIGFLIALVAVFRQFSHVLGFFSFVPFPAQALLKYSYPLSINEIVNTIFIRIDNILILQFVGVQGVEIYSIALLIAKSIQTVRESFDSPLLSIFSKKESHVYSQEKCSAMSYSTWIVLGIQIPILLVFFTFGREIIQLWEVKYLPSFPLIIILATFFILSLPGTNASTLLMGLGKTKVTLLNSIFYFSLLFLLNFSLIPWIGATGAAVALGLSAFLSSMISFYFAKYYIKTHLFDPKLIRLMGYMTLIFTPLICLQLLSIKLMWLLIVVCIISLFLHYKLIQKGIQYWNIKS